MRKIRFVVLTTTDLQSVYVLEIQPAKTQPFGYRCFLNILEGNCLMHTLINCNKGAYTDVELKNCMKSC